jgi:hypothetical protein
MENSSNFLIFILFGNGYKGYEYKDCFNTINTLMSLFITLICISNVFDMFKSKTHSICERLFIFTANIFKTSQYHIHQDCITGKLFDLTVHNNPPTSPSYKADSPHNHS